MKKLKKVLCMLLAVVVLAGCSGGGNTSTKEQEKVVDSFFTYFKEGNFSKIEDITTSNYVDTLGLSGFQKQFEEMLDKDTYGTVFVTEAQGFLDNLFGKMFKSYKIGKVEVKDDKTRIEVTGEMFSEEAMDAFDGTMLNSEITELATAYQQEHLEELTKIYQEQGMDAMQRKIFDDLSKSLFDVFNKKIDEMEYEDFKIQVVLVKEDGEYKISNILEK